MPGFFRTAAIAAALLSASLMPMTSSAQEQKLPPAVIVVVDIDAMSNTCAAGKQALTELKTMRESIQAQVETLRKQFAAEEEALVKSHPAQSDATATAAWEAKVRDLQSRKQAADAELQKREVEFQNVRNYVLQQINDAANPLITQIMRERGATIALPEAATLQHGISVDITKEVIARLDKALPKVVMTPPAGWQGSR